MITDTGGYSNLSDVELLGKLVGVRQSRRLYQGALQPLFSGAGKSHEKFAVARELVKRWLCEELEQGCVLTQPEAVRDFLRIHFCDHEHECFVVLFLDAQNRLIAAEEMFRGTLTQTSVYPREIVKRALTQNAASVVFAHNHPSGEATPSSADRALTVALVASLALIDVRVLDHFIVARSTVFSFAESGLLH